MSSCPTGLGVPPLALDPVSWVHLPWRYRVGPGGETTVPPLAACCPLPGTHALSHFLHPSGLPSSPLLQGCWHRAAWRAHSLACLLAMASSVPSPGAGQLAGPLVL